MSKKRESKAAAREIIEISDDDDEAGYEVEAVVGARGKGSKREYLIKWSGYTADESTWEPAKQLKADGCQSFIDAYEKKIGTAAPAAPKPKPDVKPKIKPDVKPKVAKPEVKPKASAATKRPADAEGGGPAKKATPPPAADAGEVLLGHIISRCVGIQHYRGNGMRYSKEPFRLRREPHNPYDKNAVAVLSLPALQKVGHVQRIDALAIARVADDRSMQVKMVGQVESGAAQIYKFPLRISFFGMPEHAVRVTQLLRAGGVYLEQPKERKSKSGNVARANAASASASTSSGSGSAASKSKSGPGAGKSAAPAPAADTGSDDEVEFSHEKTWVERNAELLKQAVVLE